MSLRERDSKAGGHVLLELLDMHVFLSCQTEKSKLNLNNLKIRSRTTEKSNCKRGKTRENKKDPQRKSDRTSIS